MFRARSPRGQLIALVLALSSLVALIAVFGAKTNPTTETTSNPYQREAPVSEAPQKSADSYSDLLTAVSAGEVASVTVSTSARLPAASPR